jgi:hypothetical protein
MLDLASWLILQLRYVWDAVSPVGDINHDLLSKCDSNPESRLYASIWIVLLPILPRCADDSQHIQGGWDVRNVVRRVPKNSDVVLICFSAIRFFVTDSFSDRQIFSANVYHADSVKLTENRSRWFLFGWVISPGHLSESVVYDIPGKEISYFGQYSKLSRIECTVYVACLNSEKRKVFPLEKKESMHCWMQSGSPWLGG